MIGDISFEVQPGTYGIVYRLLSPSGKSYIGQTTRSLESRLNQHKCYAEKSYKSGCLLLYRAIRKYGLERFGAVILATAHNQAGLDAAECFYIQRFNSNNPEHGYNVREGGSKGRLSEETKRKIGAANLGNPSRQGQPHSKETKQKISLANRGENHGMFGKHHTEEARKKISLAGLGNKSNLGKHFSEETRAKMRLAWQRRKLAS